MTEQLPKPASEPNPAHRQIRLVLGGGLLGAVLLAASLAIDLSGANDMSVPQLPKLPSLPTSFPSGFPTGLPSGFPSGFPTDFPGLPTSFPSLPALTGGGS